MCKVLDWVLLRVQRQVTYKPCLHRLSVQEGDSILSLQIVIICTTSINIKREILSKYNESSDMWKISLWNGPRNQEMLYKVGTTGKALENGHSH